MTHSITREAAKRQAERLVADLTPRQKEAGARYYGALSGDRNDQNWVAEALALSDLPIQLTPTLQADALEDYAAREAPVSDAFVDVETIDRVNELVEYRDLVVTKQEMPAENNGERFIGGLAKKLPEQPTPKLSFTGTGQFLKTSVREEGLDIQWETIYNTRGAKIDLIKKGVDRFLQDVDDSDEVAAVKLLVTSSAVNTAVLGTTGHVVVSGGVTNPPLTSVTAIRQILSDAIVQAGQFKAPDGRPIRYKKFVLVVAPGRKALVTQALSGGDVTFLPGSAGGVSVTQKVDLGAQIDVVEFPWLTVANTGATNYWFLIPRGGNRKGLVRVKAVGEEEPSVWVEGTNALIYPNGSEAPALQGKFTNETWSAKVRYVVDGGAIDVTGIMYSNGSGS